MTIASHPLTSSSDEALADTDVTPESTSPGAPGTSRSLYARITESKAVWFASFAALGTADFGSLANLTTSSFSALQGLGAAGGTGLIATSTAALSKSETPEDKLDAANNVAWGAQGLMYLVPSGLGTMEVALGLGIVGSAMQTGVGLMRVQRGLAHWDQSMVTLGILDVSGGLLWLAWDLLGARQPLFVGAYILAKAGREAYANRKSVRGFLGSIGAKARDKCRSTSGAVKRVWRDFEAGYEDGWDGPTPTQSWSPIDAVLQRAKI